MSRQRKREAAHIKGKPLICKLMSGEHKGIKCVLIDLRGDQALVMPKNHDKPFWVNTKNISMVKSGGRS